MGSPIREYAAGDRDAVVQLSLRAWAPVFAAVERILGTELSALLHGVDWRSHQARAVTEHATAWLRDAGMLMAFIATGGDPGHAPARRVYERAGYRLLPAAQAFKALEADP